MAVPSLPEYARAAVQAAVWLGLGSAAARLAAATRRPAAIHRFGRWWAAGVRRALGIRLDAAGIERLDPQETYVVVALHESFADALALLDLPLRLRFVVRDELLGWRWLGPLLSSTRQLQVCPERGVWSYRRLLREAREVVAAGESLVIFPQGSILGIETDFHASAFRLARELGRPLLPIALTGGHRVWEHPYTPRLRFHQRISLRVLPPIPVDEVRRTAPELLRREIRDRLKAAALDGSMAEPRHFVPARDGYWDGYAYRIDPRFPELAAEVERHRTAGVAIRQAPPVCWCELCSRLPASGGTFPARIPQH